MRQWLASMLLLCGVAVMADVCVQEWTFKSDADVAPWRQRSNLVKNVRCEDGAMAGVIADWDPWVTSPDVALKASFWQVVEIEMKTDLGGVGQLFYTDTNDTPYAGFSGNINVNFNVIGDNEWHVYKIKPCWTFKQLLKIRLDFVHCTKDEEKGRKSFAVRSIRIMDPQYDKLPVVTPNWSFAGKENGWKAFDGSVANVTAKGLAVVSRKTDNGKLGVELKPTNFSVYDNGIWVVVEMATPGADSATLEWISSMSGNVSYKAFDVIGDGKPHCYNLDLSDSSSWDGQIYGIGITIPQDKCSSFTLNRLRVGDEPGGPVSLLIRNAGLTDALNRAGQQKTFSFRVTNIGGEDAKNLHLASMQLPDGITVVPGTRYPADKLTVEPFDQKIFNFKITASKPVKGQFTLVVAYDGGSQEYTGDIEFTAPLGLPKYDYVPEPQPPESDYEIGALYFPGWGKGRHWGWQRIYNRCPERKPVLGWFDESQPECVDWQIKWLSENGIQFLLVDWYWNKGTIGLDHWLAAYQKCRYRKYMKWAMMWANHNAPGSLSIEDMKVVTKFWIDNYFKTPEYYCVDGKPMVMIWSPENMERDVMEQGGTRALLELADKMAKEAGLPGIHFTAMKWPEAQATEPMIRRLADMGFSSTSIYHYMGHGGKAENPRRFSFELVADSNKELWEAWYQAGVLPFFTNLSTGWDDRPWNGGCEIYGRSPALFKKICEDAKAFADRTGLKKRILMSPINEWGEGSYAEPNREFGFGMYEAVRDTFCKKPAGGWQPNYGPEDIGLPSFDDPDIGLVATNISRRTSWDFSDNTSQGWNNMMGLEEFTVADKRLKLTTRHWDSAINITIPRLRAQKFSRLVVRMKVSRHPMGEQDAAQVFWQTSTAAITERTSVSMKYQADGQFHDIVFNLSANKRFTGFLTQLRLDPIAREQAQLEIDSIRLE